MSEKWHEATKAKLKELSDKVGSGQGGPQEVKALRELPEPPTGPGGLCKAHLAVWTSLREEVLTSEEPSKVARRSWLTSNLQRHERVIAGIESCLGCEKPPPTQSTRDFSAEPPRRRGRRRRGPPRRR